MSSVLLPRVARLALRPRRQWISTSASILSSKTPSNSNNPNDEESNSCSLSAATDSVPSPTPSAPSSIDPEEKLDKAEAKVSPAAPMGSMTKGRKVTRKSRRPIPAIPKTFLATNYINHAALVAEDLHAVYAQALPDWALDELEFNIRTGLAPKGSLAATNHSDHIVCHIQSRGATYLQDALARRMAFQTGADLLILDQHDFIALAQEGYGNVMTMSPMILNTSQDVSAVFAVGPFNAKPGHEMLSEVDVEGELDGPDDPSGSYAELAGMTEKPAEKMLSKMLNDMVTRYSTMFQRLLQGHQAPKEKTTVEASLSTPTKQPRIIYLREFADMQDVFGSLMLRALMVAVEEMKQKGHPLVILAGHSPSLRRRTVKSDHIPTLTGMKCLTLSPPVHDAKLLQAWNTQMEVDATKRIAEINARHMLVVLHQKNLLDFKPLEGTIQESIQALSDLQGIQESVWSLEEVDRRVTAALGYAMKEGRNTIDIRDFHMANDMFRKSLDLRKEADRVFRKQQMRMGNQGTLDMQWLKQNCDEYEHRLLSRIIDPANVQCTFKDIRAPPATTETLQTLISLPLTRPDLFQRGILKRNFISGILLFGPPGTGKTMLAKAVAKESGSRMLEIQASDVYEMYLGEGEKNVKAIFSLARKLSPCVVFIDEVDSLMNKRRSDSTSNAHREIINQFMVEWDGLSSDNAGVVVMAATNRPFDLDDAVLRRMPRRILVDLPKEEDRAAILQLLLQDEEHNVPIQEMARATAHYSGSDLKNLCVTAALRAVRQEAITNQKQILGPDHFKEALKLVPASSSDDMESLVEIRKWAAKYGDGDKKQKQTIGFS